jgi:hypothetical protein
MQKRTGLLVITAMTLALTLFCASAAMAADPIIGTWKLDLSKSKLDPSESSLKAQTEVYEELAAARIRMELTRINKEGASTVSLSWPADGGLVQDPEGGLPQGMTVVEILLKPGEWYVTFLMNGKQITTLHKSISADRKTMRQTVRGLDPQGRTIQQVQVLRRQ